MHDGTRDRFDSVSAPGALLLGTLAVVPGLALELARNFDGARWLVGACLAVCFGGGISLALSRLKTPLWLGALLLGTGPLLGAAQLVWGAQRSLALVPALQLVWDVVILVACTVFGVRLGPGLLGSRGLRQPRLIGGALGALVVMVAQRALGEAWPTVCGVILVTGGLASFVWLVRRRRHPALWVAVAVLSTLALPRLDPVYDGLRGVLTWIALGAPILAARELAGSRFPLRSGAGPLLIALALWSASVVLADRVLASAPSALRVARGTGLYSAVLQQVQLAADLDRDEYGVAFGHRDCAPFDARVHPGAHERPDNGLDDNCQDGDAHASARTVLATLQAVAAPPPRWTGDVVVVLIDTLRYDESLAPSLTALRQVEARGLRFDHAYSTASFTVQSMLGVLTGRLAPCIEYTWRSPHDAIPVSVPPTLFEHLQRAGFDTGATGGVGPSFGPELLFRGARVHATQTMDARAAQTTASALDVWRQLDASRQRFLYVHYMEAHASGGKLEGYRASIAATDAALGELLQALGPNVLLVVTADHGESFGLHGLTGHSTQIFEEVMHVPLYVSWPGGPRGRRKELTSLLQLAPTLRAMVGAAPARPGSGPYLCLGQQPCRDAVAPIALERRIVHLHGVLGMVDGHPVRVEHDVSRMQTLAYDLTRDPDELQPLSEPPAALVSALTLYEELAMQEAPEAHWPELHVP